jgi:CubicO group peptidase (beta-lactamase class C family)
MARHRPAWDPGTRQGYHGLTLGFYEGELMRRVDPRHRTLGQFFQDEIATPLGEDVYIRLPEEISDSCLATLAPPRRLEMFIGFRPVRLLVEGLNPRSNINRALSMNPGTSVYLDADRIYARNLEVPSGGGVATARGIAHAYGVFATGGRELGLRRETLDLLAAPAVAPMHGFFDECLKGEVQFALGFAKPCDNWPFGSSGRSFGAPGAGGAMGFADPDAGLGYAYVTGRMGTKFSGDPRDRALRRAVYAAIGVREGQPCAPCCRMSS